MESKCHKLFSWAKILKFSEIYVLCMYVYKSFSTMLGRLEKERKKNGQIGKLNGSTEYEIENVK